VVEVPASVVVVVAPAAVVVVVVVVPASVVVVVAPAAAVVVVVGVPCMVVSQHRSAAPRPFQRPDRDKFPSPSAIMIPPSIGRLLPWVCIN
jgi:hypothetical protein